ncbi:LicD family protein [Mitsuokella multacida]
MKKELTNAEVKSVLLEVLVHIDKTCRQHGIKYSVAYGTQIGAIRHQGFIPWDDDVDIMLLRDDYEQLIQILKTEHNPQYVLLDETCSGYPYAFAKLCDRRTKLLEKDYVSIKDMGIYVDIFPFDEVPQKGTISSKFFWGILHFLDRLHWCSGYQLSHLKHVDWAGWSHPLKTLVWIICWLIGRPINPSWATRMMLNFTKRKYQSDYCGLIAFPGEIYKRTLFNDYCDVTFENHQLMSIKAYDSFMRQEYGDYMKFPPVAEQIPKHGFCATWREKNDET